ncbi:tumor necrosis factor receptor superfamily member 1B isoform X2 [Dromiciops gliroides]|uniref:tumor necrosis factor receptor superfamily member 1B isoform X2 n=1 Tax=Dromiciops gliroides TaxID=33562 RepID=UPI001CC5373A|nr:tumor necrosis factor receptor superfamily member 1B isoform X2 [Dromiciops gliroides]
MIGFHKESWPYTPQTKGRCWNPEKEYYNDEIQKCCDKCPPGQRVLRSCTRDSNTVCVDCEGDTHTEVWNWVKECHSCRSRCNRDFEEIQACTKKKNRICVCKTGFYCITKNQDRCLRCFKFSKCRRGFGVSKPGTPNSNVQCAACAPGTFSDTESSTDICKPHRVCNSVAVPGNETSDAICNDMVSVPTEVGTPLSKHQPGFVNPKDALLTSQPNITLGTSPQPQPQPTIRLVFSNGPVFPFGWILGVLATILALFGLTACLMSQRKDKLLSCIKEETKVVFLKLAELGIFTTSCPHCYHSMPHSAVEKSQSFSGHTGTEQQNLLDSEATSSSNSLDSMLSPGEAKEFQETQGKENNQSQAPSSERSKCGQGTRAGSMNSEHPHSGGTQVKVTCIVKVCNSDHSSQCSSHSSCPDFENSSSGSPWNEDVPFSQEESPGKGKPDPQSASEILLPDVEEKPLPVGIQDMGMKLG